jgi:photosystem II stability/assembly factor-like uncharacterized protein
MNSRRRLLIVCVGLAGYSHLLFPQTTGDLSWTPMGLHEEFISVLLVKDDPPSAIFAGSASNFSTGTQGGVFRTTNQGSTWDTLLRGFSISCIVVPSSGLDTIFVGTGNANYSIPGILKSTNGGKSWIWSNEGIYLDWETAINSIAFVPSTPHIMYAATGGFNGGLLYKSNDGGGKWQQLNPPSDGAYTAILVLPGIAGRLLVGTVGTGKLVRSTDGGDTWAVTLERLNSVICIASDTTGAIVFAGFHSPAGTPFAKSIDSGISWIQTSIVDTLQKALHSIAVNSTGSLTIFAVAAGKKVGRGIFKSNDGAMTWEPLPSPASLPSVVHFMASTGDLYVGCQKIDSSTGGVFKLNVTTGVEHLPEGKTLPILHAYPNPFNSAVTFTLDLQRRSQTKLEIFDLCGREVWRVDGRVLDAGRHEWNWFAAGEPTGIYFCRASVQARTITQKVLLIR